MRVGGIVLQTSGAKSVDNWLQCWYRRLWRGNWGSAPAGGSASDGAGPSEAVDGKTGEESKADGGEVTVAQEPTILEELESSALRLVCTGEGGTWIELNELGEPAYVAPPIDENTGFGGWGTVSVREFDEEEEEARMEAARLAAQQRKSEAEEREKKRKELEERAMAEGDDAMSCFDPWNTGVYKGVVLSDTVTAPEEAEGSGWGTFNKARANAGGTDGAPVAFKKRKAAPSGGGGGGAKFGQGKKRKQIRKKGPREDDE